MKSFGHEPILVQSQNSAISNCKWYKKLRGAHFGSPKDPAAVTTAEALSAPTLKLIVLK
jgi:hypothetical protein